MAESSKNCPACGSIIRPKAVFCHRCGRSLTNIEAADGRVVNTQSLAAKISADENEMLLIEEKPITVKNAPPPRVAEMPENTNGAGAMTHLTASQMINSAEETAEEKNAVNVVQPPPVPARPKKRYVSRTEYVWEERDAPVWRIIAFSLLIFVVVALLLWLNNSLR